MTDSTLLQKLQKSPRDSMVAGTASVMLFDSGFDTRTRSNSLLIQGPVCQRSTTQAHDISYGARPVRTLIETAHRPAC